MISVFDVMYRVAKDSSSTIHLQAYKNMKRNRRYGFGLREWLENILRVTVLTMYIAMICLGGQHTSAEEMMPATGTIQTVWTWSDVQDEDGDINVLALSSPEERTPLVALVWAEDPTSWFGTRQLYLRIAAFNDEPEQTRVLKDVTLENGSTYKFTLSYDASEGMLAVAVFEDEKETPISTIDMPLQLPMAPYSVQPSINEADIPADLQDVTMSDVFRPLGDEFTVGTWVDDGVFLETRHFTAEDDVVIRVKPSFTAADLYTLVSSPADHIQDDRIHVETFTLDEDGIVVLPTEALPVGPQTLTLEHVTDGKTTFSQHRKITVGEASVTFSFAPLRKGDNVLRGTVTLQATPVFDEFQLAAEGQWFHLTWNEELNTFEETLYAEPLPLQFTEWQSEGSKLQAEFTVFAPEMAGAWRIEVTPRLEPAYFLRSRGTYDMFYNDVVADDYPIAVTDQLIPRVLVFDPHVADWNDPAALLWSWYPNETNGFERATTGWGRPAGIKLRRSELWGGEWMLVVDAQGFAAVVSYPDAETIRWSQYIPGNLHSIELLPDGNVAIAASTEGWVRLYTSSQGPSADEYTEQFLEGAHGVLWDPERELLWALGTYELVAFEVGGSPDKPQLTKVHTSTLPTRGGHDLAPVYGDTDRLWITSTSQVYQYVKSTDTWITTYLGARDANTSMVKGVGNQPSGRIVLTHRKLGSLYEWTTDTVRFFLPMDERVRVQSAFYKARIWNPEYQ